MIPRVLTWTTQITIPHETAWYQRPDGTLDMRKLLAAFQDFFRQHSEHWIERFHYKEAGPQLLLQAFLQRIVNHGGAIHREYGLGRGRTDLLVVMPAPAREQRVVIEIKILHRSREATLRAALPQTVEYMDRCGAPEGYIVVFDRDPGRSWEERLFHEEHLVGKRRIEVYGA